MKRIFLAVATVLTISVISTSCKKCATCTIDESTAEVPDSTRVGEFCDKGNTYDNQLKIYKDNGWTCAED